MTWKKFFPDYKIIEWNEKNTDVGQNDYIRTAYDQKKWAFVSDFVRMKVLFLYGGLYFDTDVEVVREFPKSILSLDAFTGFESGSLLVSPGLVFACESGNNVVRKILGTYEDDTFSFGSISEVQTINKRITFLLKKDGLQMADKLQKVDGVTVFPSAFFCGYDPVSRRVCIEENTLCVHHYDASWLPWYMRLKFKLGTIKRRAQIVFKR